MENRLCSSERDRSFLASASKFEFCLSLSGAEARATQLMGRCSVARSLSLPGEVMLQSLLAESFQGRLRFCSG